MSNSQSLPIYSKKRAKDILNHQNISDKVASFRISNLKIGQNLTKLLSDQVHKVSEDIRSDETHFSPTFVRIDQMSPAVCFIFVGGPQYFRAWRTVSIDKSKCITELILNKSDDIQLDACISSFDDNEPSFYNKNILLLSSSSQNSNDHNIQIRTCDINSKIKLQKNFIGTATNISSTKYVIITALSNGIMQLLDIKTLTILSNISSIGNNPVIFAVSHRWVAIQVSKVAICPSDIGSSEGSDGGSVGGGEAMSLSSSGDTARKVVCGLYIMGKIGWEATVTPAWQRLYKNSNSDNSSSDNNHSRADQPQNDMTDSQSMNSTTLGTAGSEFSPSGLRIASAGVSGQVILVHALCVAGMLPSSPFLFSSSAAGERAGVRDKMGNDLEFDYSFKPQLLFKLIRGLTLARIVDIKFDKYERMAYVGSSSGTIHISPTPYTPYTPSSSISSSLSENGSSPGVSHAGSGSGTGTGSMSYSHSHSPSSWTGPTTDVAQLLELHPHLNSKHSKKCRQIVSEGRIRLPLRPLTGSSSLSSTSSTSSKLQSSTAHISKHTTVSGSNDNNSNLSTSFLQVQMTTCCAATKSNSSKSSEYSDTANLLLAVTSEGYLIRYRITNMSTSSNNNNNNPQQQIQTSTTTTTAKTAVELNRWDLRAEPGLVDSMDMDLGREQSSNASRRSSSKIPQPSLSASAAHVVSSSLSSLRHCSWLAVAAESAESPELPLYLRPEHPTVLQGTKTTAVDNNNKLLCSFLFAENTPSRVIAVRRSGPFVQGGRNMTMTMTIPMNTNITTNNFIDNNSIVQTLNISAVTTGSGSGPLPQSQHVHCPNPSPVPSLSVVRSQIADAIQNTMRTTTDEKRNGSGRGVPGNNIRIQQYQHGIQYNNTKTWRISSDVDVDVAEGEEGEVRWVNKNTDTDTDFAMDTDWIVSVYDDTDIDIAFEEERDCEVGNEVGKYDVNTNINNDNDGNKYVNTNLLYTDCATTDTEKEMCQISALHNSNTIHNSNNNTNNSNNNIDIAHTAKYTDCNISHESSNSKNQNINIEETTIIDQNSNNDIKNISQCNSSNDLFDCLSINTKEMSIKCKNENILNNDIEIRGMPYSYNDKNTYVNSVDFNPIVPLYNRQIVDKDGKDSSPIVSYENLLSSSKTNEN
eukprot:gene7996-16365_t